MSSSSSISQPNRPSASSTSSPFKKGVSISSASDPNSKRVSFPAAPAASSQSTNSQKNYRTPHPSAFAAALSQPVPSSSSSSISSSSSSSSSQPSSSSSKIFQSLLSNEKKTESLSFEIEMKEREGEGQIKNVLLQWKKAMKIGALINTGIIAFNSNGEILLIKQAGGTGGGGVWNFPMGPILAEDKESANIFNSALIEFYKEVGSEWKPSIGKKMEIMGSAFINRSTIVWILYMGEEGGKMFSSSGDKQAKWCKIFGNTNGGFQIDVDKGGLLHEEFKKAIDDYQLMQVITEAKNIVVNLTANNASGDKGAPTASKEERINEFQSKCIAMIKRTK